MRISSSNLRLLITSVLLSVAAQRHSVAGSATWSETPISGDWLVATNWIPNTVPNASSDIATFGGSNVTTLSINSAVVELDSAVFNNGAPPYTITVEIYNLIFDGAGIVNSSGAMQSLVAPTTDRNTGAIFFFNSASAGDMTSFGIEGGLLSFNDTSSAGSASFELTDTLFQAHMDFFDSSTAADATISASGGAVISFLDSSSVANATFTLSTGAFVVVSGSATADHAVATCIGGNQYVGSGINFQQLASAGNGYFTALGASSSDEFGSYIEFISSATAADGTFVINGGMAAGLAGAELIFSDMKDLPELITRKSEQSVG